MSGEHTLRVSRSGGVDRRLFGSCTGCHWQASGYSRADLDRYHGQHFAEISPPGAGPHGVVVLRHAPDGSVLGIECRCGQWGAGGYHFDVAAAFARHMDQVRGEAEALTGQGVLF